MKAVILAGGKGTRMRELTDIKPKPMLAVLGKPLIDYKLDALPPDLREIIIIVGYLKEAIMEHVGSSYHGVPVRYVEQRELNGTGGALWLAQEHLDEKFIVMLGDDIYSPEDVQACAREDWAVLVRRVHASENEPVSGGKVVLNADGAISEIVEGKHVGDTLLNTGLMVLQPDIFSYGLVQIPGRDEYGLTLTVVKAAAEHSIKVIESSYWIQVSSPEDLARAEQELLGMTGSADAVGTADSAM